MRWDQIATAWMRLVVEIGSSSAPEDDSKQVDATRTASFTSDLYEETRMTPYSRDNHTERVRLDPEGRRKAAVRCRKQALSLGNSNEWVRFLLT